MHDGGKLIIAKTIGPDNPMALNKKWIPIMTMDVWVHARCLDCQNLRPSCVDVFLKKLVNWEFVAKNLEEAMSSQNSSQMFLNTCSSVPFIHSFIRATASITTPVLFARHCASATCHFQMMIHSLSILRKITFSPAVSTEL
jgi:hypothetical protein